MMRFTRTKISFAIIYNETFDVAKRIDLVINRRDRDLRPFILSDTIHGLINYKMN